MTKGLFANEHPQPKAEPTTGLRMVFRIDTKRRRGTTCTIEGNVTRGLIRDLLIVRKFADKEDTLRPGIFTNAHPPICGRFEQQLPLLGEKSNWAESVEVYADATEGAKFTIDGTLQ